MLSTLYVYDGVIKPSILEALVKLEGLFETLNYTDHEIETSEVEMLGGLSNEDKGRVVTEAYEKHIDSLLLLLGVYLVQDESRVNLPFKVRLLEWIFALEDESSFDIVSSVLLEGETEDSLETLIELLTELSDLEPVFLYSRIEDVESKLIQRLKRQTAIPDLQSDISHVNKEIRDKILSVDKERDGVIYRTIVRTGQIPLGWPIAAAAIQRKLEDLTPAQLGKEIFLAVIASDVDVIARRQEAIALLDDLYGDSPSYQFALDSLLSYLKEDDDVKE